MTLKEKIFLAIILALIGIICGILAIKITPPSNQYKEYVLHGKVIPSDKITIARPGNVYVYYPYHNMNFLSQSRLIALNNIEWINETHGEFEISFKVPLSLTKVVLTVQSSTCNNEIVDLREVLPNIELVWGNQSCEGRYIPKEDKELVLKRVRNSLNNLDGRLVNMPFNSTEKQNIKSAIEDAWDNLGQSDSLEGKNETLLYAYYSLWYSEKADFMEVLYRLKYCLENVTDVLAIHSNKCYIPNNEDYEDYKTSNNTYAFSKNSGILTKHPYETIDIDIMKEEISYLQRRRGDLSQAKSDCESALGNIGDTFDFQKPYCEARRIFMNLTYTFGAVFLFFLGYLIKDIIEKWPELKKIKRKK